MIKIILVLSTFALLFTSCEKIIAEDLTGKVPVLILPTVNDTIDVNPVHFKWQEMEGASKYHLMVVSPSFGAINQYLLDTMVTGTDFYFQLDSNEYELMLAGTNGAYTSDTLGPIKFWVGTSTTTAPNTITLLTPLDGEYVNEDFDNILSWQPLINATSYDCSIRKGASYAAGTLIDGGTNIVTSNFPVAPVLDEGEYHWGVTGYIGVTPTSVATRQFYVDTVNPNQPVLSLPINGAISTPGTISFAWNNGTDPGSTNSPVHSVLEIATDLGFTNIISSTDLIGNTQDILLTAGQYYWTVYHYDDAGNVGSYSTVFSLNL